MIGISFIGIVILLAVLAIPAFFLVSKLGVDKRPRPQRWEKAAIMKQLLALSERDTTLAASSPSVRLRASASRSENVYVKTTAKTTLRLHAKNS